MHGLLALFIGFILVGCGVTTLWIAVYFLNQGVKIF